MRPLDSYPDAIIQEIAKRLDYTTIKELRLANRRIHTVLSDPLMWINLCERDHRTIPSRKFRNGLSAHPLSDENCVGKLDFERIWVKDPFRSNLVPPMLHTLEEMHRIYGWKFAGSGYRSSMVVEEPPVGAEPHPEISRCFATSYSNGQRQLTIDLVKAGLPEWLLDHIRPRIIVSELVAPRWDCASVYKMKAQLLGAGQEFYQNIAAEPFRELEKQWQQWTNPAHWERVEVVFDNYPAGIRTIGVISSGHDMQGWRGNYGSKFANLQIRVEIPDEFRWLTDEDISGEDS